MKITIEIDMRTVTYAEAVALKGKEGSLRWIAPTITLPDGRVIRRETRGFIRLDPALLQSLREQLLKDVSVLDDGGIESKPKYFEEMFILIREVQ